MIGLSQFDELRVGIDPRRNSVVRGLHFDVTMAKHCARDSRTPFAADARKTDDATLRQPGGVDALFAAAYQDLRKLARLRLRGGE